MPNRKKYRKGENWMEYFSLHYQASNRFSVVAVGLDFPFIDIATIPYSEHKNVRVHQGINDSIIADAIFAKPGELSFEHRIGFGFRGQLVFYLIEDTDNLGLRQLLEISIYRLFVNDVIRQGTSSAPCR